MKLIFFILKDFKKKILIGVIFFGKINLFVKLFFGLDKE